MRFFILHILLLISYAGITQISFFNSYGGPGSDYGKSIISTKDSNYTFVGATESFGNGSTDMYLVKIDSLGNFLWSKTYGGINIEWGMDLKQTPDSGYILCGYSNSSAFDYNVYLVKTDAQGDTLWTRNLGGTDWDFGYAVDITKDSTYIVAGETYSYGNGVTDGYAISVNTSGDTIWSKSFGSTGKDKFNDVSLTSSKDLLFAGSTTTNNGDTDFWVVKTDSAGNELWQYTAGDSLNDVANSIIEGNNGDYYVAGTRGSIVGTNNDLIIHQLDVNGIFIAEFIFNNPNNDEGSFVVQYAGETNLFTGGKTDSYGSGGYDIYHAEISDNGFVSNGHVGTTGTSFDDITENADTTYDHGLIMVGTTEGTANGISSVFVLKLDSLFSATAIFTETVDISGVTELPKYYGNDFVFPNPAINSIYITNPEQLLSQPYFVYNLAGQTVISGIFGKNSINISSLPSGNYQLVFPLHSKEKYGFIKQ